MCDDADDCCNQLEAEALRSNEQLLNFEVRSKNIKWQDHVVPLQTRASPVYLQRQFALHSNYREPIGDHNRREVLVCHDMMGNYLEDKHYDSSKKFDDYRFYHWNGIDYFCYFSHNYITIPPCGWLNAAHRHGVRVLGTFITEGLDGTKQLHEILQSQETVDKAVEALVRLCRHFHFEGWLLNVECHVDANKMENLYYFVERLRESVRMQVEYGVVFWYDSIVESGALQWQNEINARNVRFFRSTDAILINYTWDDTSLEKTRSVCEQERTPSQRVFFGIDIFGRGQVGKFQSKQTLARVVHYRFSTGIFAPAWTYETLQQYGYDIKQPLGNDDVNVTFLARNEKFWWTLWDHLATHPYHRLPFYTDFCLGSGKRTYRHGQASSANEADGGGGSFFNLSRQSLQPSIPLYQLATRHYDDAFNGGSCLRIEQHDISFRLFATDFQIQRAGLVCAYAYKLQPTDGELDLILRFCTGNNARDCYLFLGDYDDTTNQQRGRCYLSPFKAQYHDLLVEELQTPHIPKGLSKSPDTDGWRTRYYVAIFDGPIQVKDVGVLYRRTDSAHDSAYLGAVYLNRFNVSSYDFPLDSNIGLLQAYGGDLLN